MGWVNHLAGRLSGRDANLSSEIPVSYLMRVSLRYGCRMINGFFRMPFLKRHGKTLFLGHGVRLYCKKKMLLGTGVVVAGRSRVDALSYEGVELGNYVHLGERTVMECTGTLGHIGRGVRIGNGSCFGANCFFGAAGGITVGENVIAGQNVRFHSENHRYDRVDKLIRDQGTTHKGIRIGSDCWIGAGAVFLDGADLDDGCVVGANAVVTGRFPSGSVIAGVPARVIKQRYPTGGYKEI